MRISVFALLLFTLLPVIASGNDGAVDILYTGGIKGELEPCGCSPSTQSGGLGRLSGFISSKKGELKPLVLVDAGNSTADDTPQGRLKTEALLKSFSIIGYDAAAFFGGAGPEAPGYVTDLAKRHGVPALSDAKGRRGFLVIRRGQVNINISVHPEAEAYKKGMLNILLTDMPISEFSAKGWDAVVTSSGEALDDPIKRDGAIIVSGYPKGQKLGILTLRLDETGRLKDFSHKWQSLGGDIKDDPMVRKVIMEYDLKVAELTEGEGAIRPSQGSYLGASSCKECHQPFYGSWKKTMHASAFSSLEKAGKSRDPECVVCHSTGYGADGGFLNKSATPGLAGVQCEVCHGPGRAHIRDVSKPLAPVAENLCLKCHTGTNSPEFDHKRYLEKILH